MSGSTASKAKAIRGKPGKQGKRGPTGPAGPAGPAGAQGPAGANGKDGANGTPGTPGDNGATGPTGPTGLKGATGGTGPTGPTGSCCTPTLGSGQSETGAWSYGTIPGDPIAAPDSGAEGILSTISFMIPLATAPTPHYIAPSGNEVVFNGATLEEVAQTSCDGTAAAPAADPGHLCVYQGALSGNASLSTQFIGSPSGGLPVFAGTAGKTGALMNALYLSGPATANTSGWGTWAVTA